MAAPTAAYSLETFEELVQTVTSSLQGRALNAQLQQWLNAHYGADSVWYAQM